ncbi:gag protease polyprotein [Cucumis melo var. makuwa]|uniref:Gag protease polyprotein n=1 Tax=Cucumis melo var. makuwa TaxID=1194695 RepID=A0A5A7VHG5_CUCMM|nr:gag protease polyprotein [Cucumis melo var. makuwa]TYK26026.1 gag protease polyprotein [Cucumis melo var. makuwa]
MFVGFSPHLELSEKMLWDRIFVKGLKKDRQGFIKAFKLAIQVEALHLTVDMSFHEDDDLLKTLRKGPSAEQKRKAEQQHTDVP